MLAAILLTLAYVTDDSSDSRRLILFPLRLIVGIINELAINKWLDGALGDPAAKERPVLIDVSTRRLSTEFFSRLTH